jgi:hypothetical protein
VAGFIREHFVPIRKQMRDRPPEAARFDVQWTPTILILDPQGTERHRIEGFLPSSDFLAQLRLGLAHAERARGQFAEAERLYRQVADDPKLGDAAAEALYWAGVSRYKGSNDAEALAQTAEAFRGRFQDSAWAKKASVWAREEATVGAARGAD